VITLVNVKNNFALDKKMIVSESLSVYKDAHAPIEMRVADLLNRMTFDEKIAQMHGYWMILSETGDHQFRPGEVMGNDGDSGTLRVQLKHGLGQVTRAMGTHGVSAFGGLKALNHLQRFLLHETRLGIPAISHEECLTGVMTREGTLFPSALAYGATWHPELIEKIAEQIGNECRTVGCQHGLAPVLDVSRDVRWGRTEETFGEDPYFVGVMATRYVRGLQGPKRDVLATLKHFVGHSFSEGARNHAPVNIGWRELNDTFMLPFEMAVKQANAGSVMPAYHDIDGEPVHASRHLLTQVLRDEWGFDGLVVADYVGISLLHQHHGVSKNAAESAALAFTAGLDIELPGDECAKEIGEAIKQGLISEELVDDIVTRILREKFRLGLFEKTYQDPKSLELRSAVGDVLALQAATESIVLLENKGILPLLPKASLRIAVIGPTAHDPLAHLSGYSFPVHVILQGSQESNTRVQTPLDGLKSIYGHACVAYAQGCAILDERKTGAAVFPGDVRNQAGETSLSPVSKRTDLIQEAVNAAAAADVAIVCVGDLAGLFQTGTVGEGSDTDSLSLPGVQQLLLEQVLATKTPTIVVLSGGRPYNLGGLEDKVSAFIMNFSGGQAVGAALANVISGLSSPTARMSISVPVSAGAAPIFYNHKLKSAGTPVAFHFGSRYPFGYGLSYTQFKYQNLVLETPTVAIDGGDVVFELTVANMGEQAGVEVVQVYVRDRNASVVRPIKELKAFQRALIPERTSCVFKFQIPVDMLCLTDHTGRRVVEPGWFDLMVGSSSSKILLQTEFKVVGDSPQALPKYWRMESRCDVLPNKRSANK
jgi:beta-glucosidase